MKTLAEEIKEDIAHEDKAIEFAKESVAHYSRMLKSWQTQLTEAEEHKAKLQRQLEREEARLVRPQPAGVKVGAFNI